MSELISGKDAKLAWANGEKVQRKCSYTFDWKDITSRDNLDIFDLGVKYRRKPRTIKLNRIEVPAPFEPKEGEECCFLSDESVDGYHTISYNSDIYNGMIFGLYRVSEIKQVVAALRSIFNENN